MEKPIFIVGLPRSGSTVWGNILNENPSVIRFGELHFLTPWRPDFKDFVRKRVGDLSRDENVERMVQLVFSRQPSAIKSWFWTVQIPRLNQDGRLQEAFRQRVLRSDRSLGAVFKALIEAITEVKGYERCCVKFPVYPIHVPKLLEWFPDCRIVHIIRDPRATAVSKTNDPGGTRKLLAKYPYMRPAIRKSMILFVAFQYQWTSRVYARHKHLSNYALFRYEDLLVDPAAAVKRLCDFVEVPFKPEMLEITGAQKSSITDRKSGGIDREAGLRWKRVISPMEEKMVSLLTERAMARFGYDPDTHPLYATAH